METGRVVHKQKGAQQEGHRTITQVLPKVTPAWAQSQVLRLNRRVGSALEIKAY